MRERSRSDTDRAMRAERVPARFLLHVEWPGGFRFAARLLIPAGLIFAASCDRGGEASAISVVQQLYADFACEAVVSEPVCGAQYDMVNQPRAVLARYFDDQLVQLWLADRECATRTREICNLDFAPIWDSQDPSGTSVRILATADSGVVDVEVYRHPTSEKTVLRYTLVQTRAGWRIHDIAHGDAWSLVALLSRTTAG